MTWPARAVFALLVAATFLAFFAAQRLKGAPPVAEVRGLADEFSPNGDGFKDRNAFRVRLRERQQVTVDVVDDAGDAVRRLAGDATVAPDAPLRLAWDGRTDAGATAPDGPYRMRVTLSREGRSVVVPRTTLVDTAPPTPRVRRVEPGNVVAPGEGPVEILLGGVARDRPARVELWRTDGGAPRVVERLRAPGEDRRVVWDGRIDGEPAPVGTYLIRVSTRDQAGNPGSWPTEVPPPPGAPERGRPGLTVRTIAAEAPLRPVTSGERLEVAVDARGRPYRWSLRRAGRVNPVSEGRERAGDPVRLTAPPGDSGLYVLQVEAEGDATSVPVLVQSEDRAEVLVAVPALTWHGSTEVDEDGDGLPDTLEAGRDVAWPRPWDHGLPADLREVVAPLLVFLDRAGVRYDLTSDLDLALSTSPRATDREGVLLLGAERWVPRDYARRLRRYVADGGRLAYLGTDSLLRGVTLEVGEDRAGGRLVRPTQPAARDPFGARPQPVRRAAGPEPLVPLAGDAADPLLTAFDGTLGGFGSFQETPPDERSTVALGVETAPAEEGAELPEEAPPARPALTSTPLGDGLVIRIGLPEWSQNLDDPAVAQLTRNVIDVLRRAEPRPR